jgi:hypothetical protein
MMRTRVRVVAATLISAVALSLATSSSASASPPVWGWEFCGRVAAPYGTMSPGCASLSLGGTRVRALDVGPIAMFCLFLGPGFGMFADPGCIYLGLGGGFGVFYDPPALTVTVKGGAYKWKGKVAGVGLSIGCTSMNAKEVKIESGLHTSAGKLEASSLEYTGCKVEAPSGCEVNSGTIASKPVTAELVENTARSKVENLFRPTSGTVFAELEFKGESCAFKGTKAKVEGTTLTEGGAEDEISKEHKIEALGKPEDIELVEEAVEKPRLLWEASSKKYLIDETETEGEAKLKMAGSELTLTGLSNEEAKFAGGLITPEEGTSEPINIEEQTFETDVSRE